MSIQHFGFYFYRLIYNSDLTNIFNRKHTDVAEEFFNRYFSSLNNLTEITNSIASLITIRKHISSEAKINKKRYKKDLLDILRKNTFSSNTDSNEFLISVMHEIIEHEIMSENICSAQDYLRIERGFKKSVSKSFSDFFEFTEAIIVGSQLTRLLSLKRVKEYNELLNSDLNSFAKQYNEYIYNRLHILMIEYLLKNQFNSRESKLPSFNSHNVLNYVEKNIKREIKAIPGRKGLVELSQKKIDGHLSIFKESEDFKRLKFWRSTEGPLNGSIVLKEVANYLIIEVTDSKLKEDQIKSITNKIDKSPVLEKYLPRIVRASYYEKKKK